MCVDVGCLATETALERGRFQSMRVTAGLIGAPKEWRHDGRKNSESLHRRRVGIPASLLRTPTPLEEDGVEGVTIKPHLIVRTEWLSRRNGHSSLFTPK